MRRLSRAGFSNDFVRRAILPDWWDERCADDARLIQDLEIRAARFLDRPLELVRNADATLAPPSYPGAQLRRVREINRDRLAPAIHAAIRIASAVVRNLGDAPAAANVSNLPPDGPSWRTQIKRNGAAVTLGDILGDLWTRGIPIVPLELLPAPSFQGIACIVEGRPVILLGYKHDEPGRVGFLIAHEAGHIASGDCAPDRPVVDEEDEIADEADIERRADTYAMQTLVGRAAAPQLLGPGPIDFKDLARQASALEKTTGADASAVIFSWARQTGDYATATMAVKALYRSTGARKELLRAFHRHVDIAAAAETDRDLLRCVQSVSAPHEATH